MAQSFSVKAILEAIDTTFSSTMSKAMQTMKKLQTTTDTGSDSMNKKSNSISNTFKSMAGAIGLVQVASGAFGVVKNSLDGAISRFDTLNKYPVVMRALGYSMNDVSKSTKLLSNGIDGLPTSLDEITSSAQQLAPLVGSSQKAAKSALALNNAFLASGASAGDASRGLIQYTQMLSTGKVDMMSWRTLMETMPIALRKVANAFGFTGKSAEIDLYNALQKGQITIDQLNDKFIKLNGGVNGFASLAKKNSAGIATSFANLKNSVIKNLTNMITAIDKGFSQAGFGSIAQQLDNLKYAINGAFATIGPVVTNVVSTILKTLSTVFNFVNQNKDWLGPLAVSVVTFIGAFKGVQAAATGISSLITGLQKMQTFVRSVAAAENSIKAFFTLLGLNPWVLLIAGIAAVVAALVWFFTQTKTGQKLWQQFTTALSQSTAWQALVVVVQTIWNNIKAIIAGTMNIIMTVITTVLSIIQTVFSTGWQILVTVVSTVWNIISTVIQTVLNVILSVITMVLNIITGNWSGAWENLKTIISVVFNGIVSIISSILSGLANIIFSLVTGIVNIWTTVWKGFINVVKTIFKTILTLVSNDLKGMVNLFHIDLGAQGRAIMNSFLNGLRSAWEAVKSFVGGIASWIKKHKGPISYDRKLLIPAGVAIMTGFNKGLQDQFETVKKGVSSMAGAVSDTVSSNLETITVPSPDTRDFMNTMGALQSANQNLYRQHSVGFGGTFSDNLTIDSPTMAQENNSLLRKLADKKQDIYLDGNVLVGGTYDRYNHAFGNGVNLQGRWN